MKKIKKIKIKLNGKTIIINDKTTLSKLLNELKCQVKKLLLK